MRGRETRTAQLGTLLCLVFGMTLAQGCEKTKLAESRNDGAIDIGAASVDSHDGVAESDAVADTTKDATVRDESSGDLAGDGKPACAPDWTLCCGVCLSPQAGICFMPCPSSGSDGATNDLPTAGDAGGVTCGDATCAPDEYCYSATGGPAPQCVPHLDGGSCPPHSIEGCSVSTTFDGGACQEVVGPAVKTCRPLPSTCVTGDACACFCGNVGGAACFLAGHTILCGFP